MATSVSRRPIDYTAYTLCRLLPAAGLLAWAGLVGEQFVKTVRFLASRIFSGDMVGDLFAGLFLTKVCARRRKA